ncbi:DUF6777 domain-containing protein, partial [Streptomyces sp. 8L]|uniref:DUF6777 domain-containing protein n=1 Tax=Streptomyces sp. 8L TaxID=2877242 RepID=UPI001CD4FEA8
PSAPANSDGTGTGRAAGAARTGGQARTLPGTTPGVYGGTRGLSSCDVERQVRLLTDDKARSVAFAKAARIGGAAVPGFLRGLTPVVLRADTRVTSHGYRDRSADSFQAVLQAGTAVLADSRGLPRVRCSCGNPLGPAVAMEGAVTHHGTPWDGYRPDHVLLISPASRPAAELTLVDSADNTWMRRATGTQGDEDGVPASLPPYGPDADLFDAQQVTPPDPALPYAPSASPSAEPTGTAAPEPSSPAQPPAPTGEPSAPDTPEPSGRQAGPLGDAARPDGPGTSGGDAPGMAGILFGPDDPQG